jgi:hypothetical protein
VSIDRKGRGGLDWLPLLSINNKEDTMQHSEIKIGDLVRYKDYPQMYRVVEKLDAPCGFDTHLCRQESANPYHNGRHHKFHQSDLSGYGVVG